MEMEVWSSQKADINDCRKRSVSACSPVPVAVSRFLDVQNARTSHRAEAEHVYY